MRGHHKSKGFTLVEVLLSLVISLMLLSAVYNILIVGMKHWSQDDIRGNLVAFNGDVVMRWLERDLREARTITFAKDREVEFTVCGESIPELDNHTAALWHCDTPPDTTTIIYDATAAHHDGSFKGAGEPAWTTAGEHNQALDFDGVDDYVNCGSINLASAFTLEAWIRPDTANTNAAIIYNDNSYRLYLNSANQLIGSIYSSGWLDVVSKSTVTRDGNTWTYVALTYSQALQKLTLFINGAIAAAANYSVAVNPGTNVFLGRISASGIYPFDGLIDEVRISDFCRSMKIKFSWSGNSYGSTGNPNDLLTKTSDEGAYQLEEGYVSVFQLDYYKKDGTEANTATQIGRDAINSVKVNLTLEDEGVQASLDSVVEERNMGQAGYAGGGLPDTGQVTSYTATSGEDNDYNSTATQLSYSDNADGTITDNVTGLMWVKDPSGVAQISGSYTWSAAFTAVQNLNSVVYAGKNDWRLPNTKELWSLLHYQNSGPSIAADFTCQNNKYWSSTTYSGGTTNAFVIDFQTGRCSLQAKTASAYIRPVRDTGKLVDSGQTSVFNAGDDASFNPAAIQPDFVLNEDTGMVKTVSDNITGLMWIKNPSDAGLGGTYNWEQALAALNTRNAGIGIAGYRDWRLPNTKEMMSILNYQNNTPALDSAYFSPPFLSGTFWTSTSSVPSGLPNDQAEGVNIGDGTSSAYNKTNVNYILPVRGGA